MINHLHLVNFKASKDVGVTLANLTVLTGLNSSGKSSVLQSLALLRQTYESNNNPAFLALGGELVQVGHGRDLLSEWADEIENEKDTITIEIKEDDKAFKWVVISIPDADELEIREKPKVAPKFVLTNDFQYLQADRISPNPLYPQATQSARKMGFLGRRGEYTADYLANNFDKIFSDTRTVSKSSLAQEVIKLSSISPTFQLLDQVTGWLQLLSPGVRPTAERVEGTDEVFLRYDYVGHSHAPKSNKYRPTNVGFGLTYCLPLLVACLASKPGALLLLENPEAHLHPQGQAALGELLALAAADGVQIIVETHSDHILNGIRLAVKNKLLFNEKVALHFFTRPFETGESTVQSPSILPNGRLSNWPPKFFDQWDKSLDALLDD